MPKQDSTTEEDYLDNLLNSVLSNTGDGELKDDIFDEELKGAIGSDEDFFQSIEKDWMEDSTELESVKEDITPEVIAKETFEKYKDPVTDEYRDVTPEATVYPDKSETNQQEKSPEVPEETSVKETIPEEIEKAEEKADNTATNEAESDSTGNEQETVVEDEMKELMDILGVEQEEDSEQSQEIADLEKKKGKKKSGRMEKKGKKEKKKKEKESQEDRNLDVALELMEKSQEIAEEAEKAESEEQILPSEEETALVETDLDNQQQSGEESQSIDSLITDLGLGEGLEADTGAEENKNKKKEKKKKEKKPKKDKKAKKAKKAKKQKKPKKVKKPKKEKPPKAPDEILAIPFPFLLFMLSIGVFIVLAASFGGTYNHYRSSVNKATTYYIDQKYGKAYNELYGLEMKKGDEYFFQQVQMVVYVYRNYEAYQNLAKIGCYQDGLDSLLNGVRMFDKYKDTAREEYNCYDDMNTVLGWIIDELKNVYGITESEAREINLLGRGQQYSYKVAEIAAKVQPQEGAQSE